jgi:tetratricopeptide (TPR) repeat protein
VGGLATTYYGARRYEVAVPQLERAISLSRRTDGLFNMDQLFLLACQADSLTQLGRYQEALRAQDYRVRIVERTYGAEDPRIVPTLESVGRWYSTLGAFEQSRRTLKRAIIIVEKSKGPKDIALLGPLTALAEAYSKQMLTPIQVAPEQGMTLADQTAFEEAQPMMPVSVPGGWKSEYSDGVRLLERAQTIVSEQPSPSPAAVAEIETLIGDWYQARLEVDRARPHYARAWLASSQALEGQKKLSEILFGQPTLLHYVKPPWSGRLMNSTAPNVREKSIQIELTVGADGIPKDAKVVSAETSERMTAEALKAAQTARYRPRMESGTPVETPGVIFRESYRIIVQEEPGKT